MRSAFHAAQNHLEMMYEVLGGQVVILKCTSIVVLGLGTTSGRCFGGFSASTRGANAC